MKSNLLAVSVMIQTCSGQRLTAFTNGPDCSPTGYCVYWGGVKLTRDGWSEQHDCQVPASCASLALLSLEKCLRKSSLSREQHCSLKEGNQEEILVHLGNPLYHPSERVCPHLGSWRSLLPSFKILFPLKC